jgi:peptidoglycan/xylan/chitin deacetylase (PgdA/CDA1 family)
MIAPRNLIWKMPPAPEPTIYLTFDDGPHPVATPYVLRQLKESNARATFFCIGKCVEEHPEIFKSIQQAGHSIGNHTHNHLNGWKTSTAAYIENIGKAAALIPGQAFRPPYGRLSRGQAKRLTAAANPWKVYMWTILSGDFDTQLSPEKCLGNVLDNLQPGAIVVFHDSAKAWDRLRYALPFVLDYCKTHGWNMNGLPMN